jgi:hypothetical protein
VSEQINKAAAEERKKNRATLSRILQAIEYRGCLSSSLQGHHDSGKLQTTLAEAGSDVDYDEAGSDISYTKAASERVYSGRLAVMIKYWNSILITVPQMPL